MQTRIQILVARLVHAYMKCMKTILFISVMLFVYSCIIGARNFHTNAFVISRIGLFPRLGEINYLPVY